MEEREQLSDGARDVAHRPVQEHFAQIARNPRAASLRMRAGESSQLSEKQYGVLQLIGAYRFQGARAPNTFVALKDAGIETVAMYFGSWNEWSRLPELPIEEGAPMVKAA